MKSKITLALLFVLITASVFAAVIPEEEEGYIVPSRIANNEFFLESVRLNKLAIETFEYGDYEASTNFAEESIRFAELSSEFTSSQLIAEANRLLTWVVNNNLVTRYQEEYDESRDYYEVALAAHSFEDYEVSITSAINSIEILWQFETVSSGYTSAARTGTGAGTGTAGSRAGTGTGGTQASQYTVRTWANERDCLWNIAGYSFVYNDPWQWRRLYEANRSKLPEPGNPDLILPGTVLDIPRP